MTLISHHANTFVSTYFCVTFFQRDATTMGYLYQNLIN